MLTKAARLHQVGSPLKIEEIPEPRLRPGGAIIRVLGSHVVPFTSRVLSGELGYMLPTPFPITPGPSAIALVESVAEDVFGLKLGEVVFADPWISSRVIGAEPDGILIGWTGLAPAAGRMQSLWKDGAFAEKALWPAECLTPLVEVSGLPPERLAIMNYLTIAYGGLLRGDFRAGSTLVVTGATGGLGVSSVIVALALGASRIVAVARDVDTGDGGLTERSVSDGL